MHLVFVFGTLKEGFPNFKTNKGKRYGGSFRTKNRFPLMLVGDRYSPWLLLECGKGFPVSGQVFSVDDETLASMDKLERVDEPDGYRRIKTTVVCMSSGQELDVFVYGKPPEMLNVDDIRVELEGDYLLEHAKLYRSRTS